MAELILAINVIVFGGLAALLRWAEADTEYSHIWRYSAVMAGLNVCALFW